MGDVILKYTPQTPTRVILLSLAMGFFSYTVANLATLNFNSIIAFIFGVIILLVRELISNGDHFNEFEKHLRERYEILPAQSEEEPEEPKGYG